MAIQAVLRQRRAGASEDDDHREFQGKRTVMVGGAILALAVGVGMLVVYITALRE
jgi:hypothetical protein